MLETPLEVVTPPCINSIRFSAVSAPLVACCRHSRPGHTQFYDMTVPRRRQDHEDAVFFRFVWALLWIQASKASDWLF